MNQINTNNIERQLKTSKFNLIDMSNIGEQLINAGNYELASKVFARIVELNGNNPAAWCNLGVSLMKLHKYEDAETVFLHSLTLNDKYYPK